MRLALTAALVLVAMPVGASADTEVSTTVSPGVMLTQVQTATATINILTVDPSIPGVSFDSAIARDSLTAGTGDITQGRETASSFASRKMDLWQAGQTPKYPVAVVNADYFGGTGDPLGFGIRSGEFYSEPWTTPRAAFGYDAQTRTAKFGILSFAGKLDLGGGSIVKLNAINRPVSRGDANDVVAYTQLYGPTTGGRPGCTEVVVSGIKLPLAVNQSLTGNVQSVTESVTGPSSIPDDGIVISAAGSGASANLIRQLKVGDPITFAFTVTPISRGNPVTVASNGIVDALDRGSLPPSSSVWGNLTCSLGGGPRLLVDGMSIPNAIDAKDEGFDDGFANGPHSRTGIGATHDGKIIIVAIEGKPFVSAGVSLRDEAQILADRGAVNAINFDGGGSTTMVVNGVTVNYPNLGTGERRVADMLAVYAERPPVAASSDLALVVPTTTLALGKTAALSVRNQTTNLSVKDMPIVWGGAATNGIGYVTQDGVFTALRAGTGTVTAVVNDTKLTAIITVLGQDVTPDTYNLVARLLSPPETPGRSTISLRLNMLSGLPGARIPIRLTVSGGTIDQPQVVTDEDGLAKATITWTASKGEVKVEAGTLAPMTLTYISK